MILVDTNVISEPLRKSPHAGVIAWLDAQALETLYLSAITVAELRFGLASLPPGKRRDGRCVRQSLGGLTTTSRAATAARFFLDAMRFLCTPRPGPDPGPESKLHRNL